MTPTTGLRARVRAELTQEIKEEARRQLAEAGAASLSLRAVAREVGMVSSGIYRYFKSRDQLLTALIIDAYDDLGVSVEAADVWLPTHRVRPTVERLLPCGASLGVAHPHEYALSTVRPFPAIAPLRTPSSQPAGNPGTGRPSSATRPAPVGFEAPSSPNWRRTSRSSGSRGVPHGSIALHGVPMDAIIRALEAWTQLFGAVNFEIFGRLIGTVEDVDALFDQTVKDMAAFVGIANQP